MQVIHPWADACLQKHFVRGEGAWIPRSVQNGRVALATGKARYGEETWDSLIESRDQVYQEQPASGWNESFQGPWDSNKVNVEQSLDVS